MDFFKFPQEILGMIYEYDPTYHSIWRNIFDRKNYRWDGCIHGKWSSCPHPECKRLHTKIIGVYIDYEEEEEIDAYICQLCGLELTENGICHFCLLNESEYNYNQYK